MPGFIVSTLIGPEPDLTFFRNGHHISVPPDTLARLGGDVAVPRRSAMDDRSHGYDVRETPESLLQGPPLHDPTLGLSVVSRQTSPSNRNYRLMIPNAGLTDYFQVQAARIGKQLRETSCTPLSTIPEPVPFAQIGYPAFVSFVRSVPRGMIRVPEFEAIALLTAELAAAYPNQRILLVGRVEELKRVHAELDACLPQLVCRETELSIVHGGRQLHLGDDQEFPRMICCTPTGAADLDSEKADIVLMLDAFQALNESMQLFLIQTDARFHLFGFWQTDRKPTPYELAKLRSVFGFEQIDLKSNGRVRRTAHYAWIRQGRGVSIGVTEPTSSIEKPTLREPVDSMTAYVYNHARNDQICRLAKKLRSDSQLNASTYGEISRWIADRGCPPVAVTILVDRLDHAYQLARRLDGWEIVADPKSRLHNLPESFRRRINQGVSNWFPGRIVVSDIAQKTNGYHSNVVIWAGGGLSIDIPEFWFYTQHDPSNSLLIVDFTDDFTPTTRLLSKRRQQSLIEREVFPVGTSPVFGRIQRFEQIVGAPR